LQQRSLARRSATAVGCGLILFIAGQLFFSILMDRHVQQLRDPEFGFKLRRLQSFLRRQPGRPLVLAVGSSHTEMGLRPDVIPLGRLPDGREPILFNAAMNGNGRLMGPLHELLVLDRLLREGIRPRWVIAEIMPSSLGCEALKAAGVQAGRLSWSDLHYLTGLCSDRARLYRSWCSERALPCYSRRFTTLSLLAPNWIPVSIRQDGSWRGMDPSGWRPYPHSDLEPGVRKILLDWARAEHAASLAHLRVSGASDRLLHELIDLCQRHGIALTFLLTPEGETFRSWYSAEGSAKLNDYLRNLSHETGIVITDARRWQPESDFFDSHHLMASGATAFSERLGRELVVPFVRGQPSANLTGRANLRSMHLQ
jgi:hypothetical protein